VRRGPPIKAAFDAQGNPTKAAEGFARSQGVEVSDLERREIEGGEYVVALVREEGRPTAEVLSEILPGLLASIKFDKPMRWNWSGVAFSRPIRWLVSLYGEAVVPFAYADVGAGQATRGTRLAGSPEIQLTDAAAYFGQMATLGVIVDQDARGEAVRAQVTELAEQTGGVLVDDPELLAEVTNLVEQPTALLGRFEPEYLSLPRDVLTTVMRKHQRYFAVADNQGNLLPYFIAVRNGDSKHLDSVIRGNEHVIRARFADARFFYDQDIDQPLGAYLPKLKTLTFQETLGSYYDKAARLEGLTARLGAWLGLDGDDELDIAIRAARLAKADLATQMVVELTSLQGIMGREYALRSGEQPAVAQAIAEHYLPRYAGDYLPQSYAGVAVALADRLDSLVGLFAVGLAPSGASDPYGLRRAALGVVNILLGHRIDFDLRRAVELVGQAQPVPVTDEVRVAVLEFIAGRLRVILRESTPHDVVEAVLGAQGHNPHRAAIHVGQLAEWVARPDWQPILDAYARCVRITRSQEKQFKLKPEAFSEPVERALYAAYQQAAGSLGAEPDADTMLTAFAPMVPAISAFFATADEGGVLVMHPTKAIRENRLALLQRISALADGVADFSVLEGF
jgi:glycyl-tRNA synthetase